MRLSTTFTYLVCLLFVSVFMACSSKIASEEPEEEAPTETGDFANIVSVSASGAASNYQFSVGIRSPDVDCDQYANWWEVVSMEGTLLYRRILAHSHPSEQPFVRSGGPVPISETQEVIIRAHMHPSGYGGTVYRGSVESGFQAVQLEEDFAVELSESDPLPTVCTG